MSDKSMGNTLYLECRSGISGDMFVASLIDLGASSEVLKRGLESLPVDGFEIAITRVKKSGLDVCDFDVILDEAHENHDHDMEYLHGEAHSAECGDGHGHAHDHGHMHDAGGGDTHNHAHDAECGCAHDHAQAHDHGHVHGEEHAHPHMHRGLPEIYTMIDKADITPRAKEISRRIFEVLAKAESKAHGVPMNEVHFHEVGAVDSIADVVAAGICLDDLDITEVVVPDLWEGTGTVRCQHGILPIPVPAVANIVMDNQIKLHVTNVEGELVTPTGAAIVAAVRTSDTLPEHFSIERIGLGAGKREYKTAGFVRAMIIRA